MSKFVVKANTKDGIKVFGFWCNNSVGALISAMKDLSPDGVHAPMNCSFIVKKEK